MDKIKNNCLSTVFVALGGNIGDSLQVLNQALTLIRELSISDLRVSKFYRTSPVSEIPQNSYVNAVCNFQTQLRPRELFIELEKIEKSLGKIQKLKNEPRSIDLDILFFGEERYNDPDLEIPHPRWKERLFVLIPLNDLVTHIVIPSEARVGSRTSVSIKKCIRECLKNSTEEVIPIN